MELTQLRYFVAAAQAENFRRAAAAVHVSQPALSRQIHNLEVELGVALFERSRGRVRLSPAGREYLKDVQRLIRELEWSGERAKRIGAGKEGVLRIGLMEVAGRYRVVSETFHRFRADCPDVDLKVAQMFSGMQFAALEDGTLDIGIATVPPEMPFADIDRHDIATVGLGVAMAEAHPLARRDRIRLADLADYPFIFFPRDLFPVGYDRLMQACLAGGLAPKVRQEVNSESATLTLVSVSDALSLVLDPGATPLHHGVVFKSLEDLVWPATIALFWRRGHESPLTRRFIDTVASASDKTGRRST